MWFFGCGLLITLLSLFVLLTSFRDVSSWCRFEMMHGRTPFYDKNRKLMFYRIINTEPSFPPTFSPEACTCIRGMFLSVFWLFVFLLATVEDSLFVLILSFICRIFLPFLLLFASSQSPGLLRVDENERMGSGPRGAEDIKNSDFFRVLDFGKVCLPSNLYYARK